MWWKGEPPKQDLRPHPMWMVSPEGLVPRGMTAPYTDHPLG